MPLKINNTPLKGRGIFAGKNYIKGEIIETCPMLVLSEQDREIIDKTALYNYYFSWGKDFKEAAIALGFGSLYNHSFNPNAFYRKNTEEDIADFIAFRDILKGEEITVNYNGDPLNVEPIWFKPIDE